jgi:hypothetical protein
MPNRFSKYQVIAQLSSGHVQTDMGKSERVESLHTAGGPTDYLRSATVPDTALGVRSCDLNCALIFIKTAF